MIRVKLQLALKRFLIANGASFQISNDENESYRTGETIKFSSNIALRKIDSKELPIKFYKGDLKLCK